MSETRSANPELQLDVDVMILEYLLYTATSAQLKALKSSLVSKSDGSGLSLIERSDGSAKDLVEGFNAFLSLFNATHKTYVFDGGTTFSLMLLEALILLAQIIDQFPDSSFGADFVHNAQEETRDFARQRELTMEGNGDDFASLAARNASTYNDTLDIDAIASPFLLGTSVAHTIIPKVSGCSTYPVFRLLNRLIVLSARVSEQLSDKDVNEQWMRPACEFMLHAALETLDTMTQFPDEMLSGQPSFICPGILACFSFRCLSAGTLELGAEVMSASALDEEAAISAMFAPVSTRWDEIRQEYLLEFVLPKLSHDLAIDERAAVRSLAAAYERRIPRLRRKYPFEKTQASVLDCLESLWSVNCSEGFSGKPVLVQIEEGGLEGMGEREFESFLGRVGLDRGWRFGQE